MYTVHIWHRHVAWLLQVQSPTSYSRQPGQALRKVRTRLKHSKRFSIKQESIVLEPVKAISPQFITWAVLCIPALGMSFLFAPAELDLG